MPLALIGATALYLTYAWLASAILASYLSNRKGYGERPGLASGMLLHVIGAIAWIFWPAKEHSAWKQDGPLPRRRPRRVEQAEAPEEEPASESAP